MLSLAILVIAVAAGLFSFTAAHAGAYELQDDVLRQVAALLQRRGLSTDDAAAADPQRADNEESRVIVQHLGQAETSDKPLDAGGKLTLPETLRDGLQNYTTDGEEFRLLVKTTAAGERLGVAQEAAFRDEIARNSALRAVMSFLILVPVLPLIVVLLVRRMFRPVAALSLEVDERSEQALHPIQAAHVPDEVRPFIVAINRLLARAQTAMERPQGRRLAAPAPPRGRRNTWGGPAFVSHEAQRRFVADAAHELRTPLTALSLQAERLAETPLSPPAAERLQALRQGIDRGRGLLEQLLALARAQTLNEPPASVVSIQAVYRRVLEDLMPLVEAKSIDIGVEGSQDAQVTANEVDFITLVKNLVDNAIRFAPVGGRVDLSVSTTPDQQVLLRVCDDGPGIPLNERSRVFDPFYRSLGSAQTGSGLGLAIVKAIADRLGAQVLLNFADETKQSGLCITVSLPSAG